jgi:hypothetical protein
VLIPTIDRQDMEVDAMIRRAAEQGERLESYDPQQLVEDVQDLLRRHGRHPELPAGCGRIAMALEAADQMIRAHGMLPAGDYAEADVEESLEGEHPDMDMLAMVRRAYARGEALESFDPDLLVVQVRALLRERRANSDLPPGTGRGGMAVGAAGMMLRALGILPAGDYTTIDRRNAPDPESR